MSAEREEPRLSAAGSPSMIRGRRETSASGWGRLRVWLGLGLIGLFLLHQDYWNWENSELALGLPIGLLYHLVYCFAVALYMAMLLRLSPPLEPPP